MVIIYNYYLGFCPDGKPNPNDLINSNVSIIIKEAHLWEKEKK